jgi:hypothetical protein
MVANNGIFVYNPINQTYNFQVTKTYKKNKRILNANDKLLILAWTDPDPATSVVTYEVFATSIANNTVLSHIYYGYPLMTGNSHGYPP